MNTVILSGNLGAGIAIRTIGNGAVVGSFSLATTRAYTNRQKEKVKDTQWHRVEVWGKTAENMERWTHKGSKVTIIGELVYDTFKNREGETVTLAKVKAQQVKFLDTAPKQPGKPEKAAEGKEKAGEPEPQIHGNIDDLPF